MPVYDGEEEIVLLAQILFDSTDHHRAVRVADLLGDDSHRIGSLLPQGAREKIRAIVEFLRSGMDPTLGALRNGSGGGCCVQHR